MKCIILGAGEGTRLRPHTLDRPKCLVELNGRPILDYIEDALRTAGVTEMHVVTGYRAELIERRGESTFHNPRFDSTNMVASLMCAAELLDGGDDILVSYADIVFEPGVVSALAECDAATSIAVNTRWRDLWSMRMEHPLEDAETLKIDEVGNVVELGKQPSGYDDIQGQYMGLIKFRADFARQIIQLFESLDPDGLYDGKDRDNMYMTSYLQHWIDNVGPMRAVRVDGGWLEVDTSEDLALYHKLLSEGALGQHCSLPQAH